MENEIWKWVPGFEGKYQVSDFGRVKSFCRYPVGIILRPGTMNKFGHVSVSLLRNNSRCVHELVLTAFIGARPLKFDACHINGIGSDNRLCNLKWASRSENNEDAVHVGKRKLTVKNIREIKLTRLISDNVSESISSLSERFKVSKSLVTRIWYGTIYERI